MDFATLAAHQAGTEILPYFRSETPVENKRAEGFDPVTEADRAAERRLRELIEDRFPEHGVWGEEFGRKDGNGLTWVIDPIDGTRAFMCGMLHWGLVMGLYDGENALVGVMHQPFTGETWAGDGKQATYTRGDEVRALRTRPCSKIADAVLATTTPRLFHGRDRAGFERLQDTAKLTRYGGDCYLFAMLAMGFLDLATDATLNAYDILGLIPIIEGAGGVISTYTGESACLGGTVLAAGDRALHRVALDLIAESELR